jgi:hypothetical protein
VGENDWSIYVAVSGSCRSGAFRSGFVTDEEDIEQSGSDQLYKWSEKKVGSTDSWVEVRN